MKEESSWLDTVWGLIVVTRLDRKALEGTLPPHRPQSSERPGQPRKNWLVTSLGFCVGPNISKHLTIMPMNSSSRSYYMQEIEPCSLVHSTVHAVAIAIIRDLPSIYHLLAWGVIPFCFTSFACHFGALDCFSLVSHCLVFEFLSKVPNGHLSRKGLARHLRI